MSKYQVWDDIVGNKNSGYKNLKKGMFLIDTAGWRYYVPTDKFIMGIKGDGVSYHKLIKKNDGIYTWKHTTKEELKTQLEIRKTDLYKAVYGE